MFSYIIPNWVVPKHVKAISSTRVGGFSSFPYNELNLSIHVGDDLDLVHKNRQYLTKLTAMPSYPVWLKQTHSNCVEEVFYPPIDILKADGIFTQSDNIICAVMTADCLPILLTDIRGTQIAALHAGWRGLANGIIENALNKFDGEVIAWLGPTISDSFFEVGEEVIQAFVDADISMFQSFQLKQSVNKYLVNLPLLASKLLHKIGVTKVVNSGLCTFNNDCFFSYRRDGVTGRQASFIWIED
ncbi:peptidoglycan editing factor PgeF [Candidatus Photodesmus anomalopis]|uniref:Purine nucleoside phosphorylase n=1 Tax=Candidatus Photodesmus katoptron Akat1 TaxID=1236703 RepID=S3DI20_9GAMM|nr:peptidoglycan editing factor PgeF [Candidatus Photodesmus katoptron]EPE37330.1 hypothetical protein O1U_0630 [Candidatus Photodesmus katoptron Akat1]